MNLRQLRYLLANRRQGSFTRAAERLFVPAISGPADQEPANGELGGPVAGAPAQGVRLTTAGKATVSARGPRGAVEHAERATRDARSARDSRPESRSGPHGDVDRVRCPAASLSILSAGPLSATTIRFASTRTGGRSTMPSASGWATISVGPRGTHSGGGPRSSWAWEEFVVACRHPIEARSKSAGLTESPIGTGAFRADHGLFATFARCREGPGSLLAGP